MRSFINKSPPSLSYSTALVLDAGTDNVFLICVFIRFISCLLRKVKYCSIVSALQVSVTGNARLAVQRLTH